MGGSQRIAAAAALEAEYPNLQVALQRALDTNSAELGLRLARALQFVWKHRLPNGEGRAWLEQVLALSGAEACMAPKAVSLLTVAWLAWERHDYAAAECYYAEAVPLARSLGDPWILFVALADQSAQAEERGDYPLARSFMQEANRIVGAAWGAPIAQVEVQIDRGPWMPANDRRGRGRRVRLEAVVAEVGEPVAGEHAIASRATDVDGHVQPAQDDPSIAGKHTYWESNGQVTRRVRIA